MLGPVLRPPLDSSFPRVTDPRSTAPFEGEESGRRKDNERNQLEESLASGLTSTHSHLSNLGSCGIISLLIANFSLLFSRVLINYRHSSFQTWICKFSSVSHVLSYRCRCLCRRLCRLIEYRSFCSRDSFIDFLGDSGRILVLIVVVQPGFVKFLY